MVNEIDGGLNDSDIETVEYFQGNELVTSQVDFTNAKRDLTRQNKVHDNLLIRTSFLMRPAPSLLPKSCLMVTKRPISPCL